MSSDTRLRSNVCTVFDVFCEVGISGDGAVVLQKYPKDFTDEATLKSICQFSFPCPQEGDLSEAVQLFSFVLTDSQSQYTYGYCRFTPRNNTCILMMTGFPWHNVFYKILNHVSVVMNTGTQEDVDGLLTRIYHTDIPNVGEKMHFEALNGQHPMDVDIPDLNKLPTLREDKYMLEFFNSISQRQMIAIYASLLKERRIIFTGRKLSQLCSCIHAASTLIFPMHWQYLFIPVLPHTLKDMLQAPMPFMIGVPKQVVNTNEIKELGDVMIVDLEDKTLQGSHDDTADLPPDILSFLKNNLKSAVDMGDSLSRTFLRANVQLFGGYRLGFVRNEETWVISWDKDKFVSEQRTSHQSFLNSLLGSDGVQYLERFIGERMKALNLGLPVTDEFEREINNLDNNGTQLTNKHCNKLLANTTIMFDPDLPSLKKDHLSARIVKLGGDISFELNDNVLYFITDNRLPSLLARRAFQLCVMVLSSSYIEKLWMRREDNFDAHHIVFVHSCVSKMHREGEDEKMRARRSIPPRPIKIRKASVRKVQKQSRTSGIEPQNVQWSEEAVCCWTNKNTW